MIHWETAAIRHRRADFCLRGVPLGKACSARRSDSPLAIHLGKLLVPQIAKVPCTHARKHADMSVVPPIE